MSTPPRRESWVWTAVILIAGLASCCLGTTALVMLVTLLLR